MRRIGIWSILTLVTLILAIVAEATYLNIIVTGLMIIAPLTYLCFLMIKDYGTDVLDDAPKLSVVQTEYSQDNVEQLPPKRLLVKLYELDVLSSEISVSNDNDMDKAVKLIDIRLKKEVLRSEYSSFYKNESKFRKKNIAEKVKRQREVMFLPDHEQPD